MKQKPYRTKIDRILSRLPDYPGPDACWIWPGAVAVSGGYGKIGPGPEGGTGVVHRIVYEYLVGSIPDGLDLDHLCRVPVCTNPAHLEPVTRQENLLRGLGNQYVGRRHCKNGHEFTPENTYIRPDHPDWRYCRKCNAQAQQRYQERRQA